MEAALLAGSISEGGGASSSSSSSTWAAAAAPDVLLGVGRQGARAGLAYVALGLLIGVVIIALFPARSPASERWPPSSKTQTAASTNSPSEGAFSQQEQQRRSEEEEEESVVAALADERKWIRRFSGWQAALGLSDEQLHAAVARARAEAAGASSAAAAAAAAAAATGGGNASGSAASQVEKHRQRDDAAADYGSLSARVDLLFYSVAFAALIYFVQRDYGGSPSLLAPAAAALGGGARSGGGEF